VTLLISQYVDLPPHKSGGFDHADVHLASGRVYVAHTAAGTVEVIDGESAKHMATLPGCIEASGVVCALRMRNWSLLLLEEMARSS